MLLGSDGPGGIEFDDAELARPVGIVGLVAILYEGGLSTSWRRLREVAVPAALLSTVGVVVTALLTGLVAQALFDLSWLEAILLGAVVASTDAAAVFATLRFTNIRRRLARTLEAETGGNDPMAIALTVGLIAWIEHPDYGFGDLVVLDRAPARARARRRRRCSASPRCGSSRASRTSIGAFAPVASVAAAALSFGVADVLGGSGFLAVYLVGLAVGSTPSRYRRQLVAFHEGLAFVAQVAMFVVLGLLVFPRDLPDVALAGLALALLLVVRDPPGRGLGLDGVQRLHQPRAGAARLGRPARRGADRPRRRSCSRRHVRHGETIFNAVFFVVVVSALVQGTTLEWVAQRLGRRRRRRRLVPRRRSRSTQLGRSTSSTSPSPATTRSPARPCASSACRASALVAVVARGDETIPPRGSTRHRARRPALRPRAACEARRPRGRVLALAAPDLGGLV